MKLAAKRLWLGFYVLSYSGWIIETKAAKSGVEASRKTPCLNPMLKALKKQSRRKDVQSMSCRWTSGVKRIHNCRASCPSLRHLLCVTPRSVPMRVWS